MIHVMWNPCGSFIRYESHGVWHPFFVCFPYDQVAEVFRQISDKAIAEYQFPLTTSEVLYCYLSGSEIVLSLIPPSNS
jgi:hypothetical protein